MPYLTIIQRLLRIRPQLSMLLSLGIECSWISCDTRGLDAGFPWLNHSAIKSRFHSFRFIGGWHSTTLGRCFLDVSCSALKDSVNREKRAGIAIHEDSFPFSHLTRGFGRYALDQCSDDECDALEVDDPKTQTLSLAPFGSELSLEDRAQDNIVWNFVVGITIAREILEHDGSVLRMLSPYLPNALLGAGGTQIEIWLPVVPAEGAK